MLRRLCILVCIAYQNPQKGATCAQPTNKPPTPGLNVKTALPKIVSKAVSELTPADYNPRQMTKEQAADLRSSIQKFGLIDPLIVNTHPDRYNILVGGHMRLQIAKELGLKEVPCVEVQLTEAEEKQLNIRLNKNTGEWDWDALANHFDADDLLDLGFKDWELGLKDTDLAVTADEAAKLRSESGDRYDDLDIQAAHIRLVQLFLTQDQLARFNAVVDAIKEEHQCTITDAVMHVIDQYQ